ncbi:MAG: Na+/H+ antiporter NhaC family protein [Myxococcota bacterium]
MKLLFDLGDVARANASTLLAFPAFMTLSRLAAVDRRDASSSSATLTFGVSLLACFGAQSGIWIASSTLGAGEAPASRRVRDAFILDATAAPVASLAIFNLWGAYMVTLLKASGVALAETLVLKALALNVYSLLVVAVAGVVAVRTDRRAGVKSGGYLTIATEAFARIPLLFKAYVCLFVFLKFLPLNVDSLDAVLLASVTVGSIAILERLLEREDIGVVLRLVGESVRASASPVLILTAGLFLSRLARDSGIGKSLFWSFADSTIWIGRPAAAFLASSLVSLLTGSSWATMALAFPAVAIEGEPLLVFMVGAVVSGAILGDHASPVSDTTIASAVAAGVRVREHALFQSRYVALCGAVCFLFFILVPAVFVD